MKNNNLKNELFLRKDNTINNFGCLRLLVAIFVFWVWGFVFVGDVWGASYFRIDPGYPASVTDNQEFQVQVSLRVDNSAGNFYYLRAAFYHPDNPSNDKYFGYTKNHNNVWYNGEPSIDKTQFKKIQMRSGETTRNTWVGMVEIRPDMDSAKYTKYGGGMYKLKIGRYTEGQTSTTPTAWSDPVDIEIVGTVQPTAAPTPTLAVTPTPTGVPTVTPTPTPVAGSTPTPTATLAPTPTSVSAPTPTPRSSVDREGGSVVRLSDGGEENGGGSLVLGIQRTSESLPGSGDSEDAEGSGASLLDRIRSRVVLAVGLVFGGLLFLGVSVFVYLRGRDSGKMAISDE